MTDLSDKLTQIEEDIISVCRVPSIHLGEARTATQFDLDQELWETRIKEAQNVYEEAIVYRVLKSSHGKLSDVTETSEKTVPSRDTDLRLAQPCPEHPIERSVRKDMEKLGLNK